MRFSSSLTRNKTTHLCKLLTRNGNKWTSKHEQRHPAPSRRLMEVRVIRKSRGGWAGVGVPGLLISLGAELRKTSLLLEGSVSRAGMIGHREVL